MIIFCSPTIKVVSPLEIYDIFQRMSDYKIMAALPTSDPDIKAIKSAFASMPKILREGINYDSVSICTDRNHIFTPSFVKITNSLISGGIIQHWFNYLLNFEFKGLIEPPKEPKVFEVEDLKFGFIVWLAACAISLAAFLVEIFYVWTKREIIKFVRRYSGLIFLMKFFLDRNIPN